MTVVDVQISPTAGWRVFLDATLAAESAGFGAVWVFDHLAGRSVRAATMYECFTWLGALAVATKSIGLGALVANVWNREPGVLGVAAATVTEMSGRQLLLGLGAGTSPTSPFAGEQIAVGATIRPSLAERHERVEQTLDLLDRMWAPDRGPEFDTFPLPEPRPITVIGVNSTRLAAIAGARADGINVWWSHPRRTEILLAAEQALTPGRPFLRTTYEWWDEDLLDPSHPARIEMSEARIDRLVLADHRPPDAARIAALRP